MRTLFLAWILGAGLAAAQEAPAIDMEARRESVVTLQTHIEMREKRLEEVKAEIKQRAEKTNAKIGDLVKLLSGLKDSQDSKRRVSQVKGEAIGGLKRMIEVYRTEGRKIAERLRKDPGAAAEGLSKDLDLIDQLVQKRAEEIVELVKSMPPGTDVSKYEQDGSGYYYGIYYENSRISEAWRQNRRDKVESAKQRREVQQALEKAIADLESRHASIEAFLKLPNKPNAEREIQLDELIHIENLLEQRKAQLAEVSDPSANTSGADQAATKDQADELREMLGDARRDISSEFNKNLRLYREAAGERDKIAALRENLAAREKWLEENDPAKKGE
ncbi:hypothetical protein [Luteolibacter marinus]|uniref:hypothetical protein n=1 Tax=Luteolibacter marinus TaxID=2776705 RepID=UPI0018669641|nr:hypothetical protein [Luteolibacter marinus]